MDAISWKLKLYISNLSENRTKSNTHWLYLLVMRNHGKTIREWWETVDATSKPRIYPQTDQIIICLPSITCHQYFCRIIIWPMHVHFHWRGFAWKSRISFPHQLWLSWQIECDLNNIGTERILLLKVDTQNVYGTSYTFSLPPSVAW